MERISELETQLSRQVASDLGAVQVEEELGHVHLQSASATYASNTTAVTVDQCGQKWETLALQEVSLPEVRRCEYISIHRS